MIFHARVALAALLFGIVSAGVSHGGVFTVSTTADSGPGSLRQAITSANTTAGDDNIVFDLPGAGPHVIELATFLPQLDSNIAILNDRLIDEPVEVRRSTASGTPEFSVFRTTSGRVITIAGLKIRNGKQGFGGAAILNNASDMTVRRCVIADNGAQFDDGAAVTNSAASVNSATMRLVDCVFSGNRGLDGGAIRNSPTGSLFIDNCNIAGNSANFAGGIRNEGYVLVTNSTFSSNVAIGGPGGAIYSQGSKANMTIRSCTFVANSATNGGGGGSLYNDGGVMVFGNNIFSPGVSGGTLKTINSQQNAFFSTGKNISSDAAGGDNQTGPGGLLNGAGDRRNTDPRFGTPYFFEGARFVYPLLAESPAVNSADATRTTPRDQRGYVRQDAPDIGAFELNATIPVTLANISTRLAVGTGDDALIGGFIVTGLQPKRVIVRALGPSTGVPGALADPQLQLFNGAGEMIAENDNWRSAQEGEIVATGVAPADEFEAAVVRVLAPGAYTAVVSGVDGGTGVALVEAYDLDRTVASKLANISTRGFVQEGDNVMIGGFIVTGPDTLRPIIRAIGPSLGIPGALPDPLLELYDSNGVLLQANDNWRTTQQADIQATGIPPSSDQESAIVLTTTPGAYTAIVRGKNGATGLALVEVYGLPNTD